MRHALLVLWSGGGAKRRMLDHPAAPHALTSLIEFGSKVTVSLFRQSR